MASGRNSWDYAFGVDGVLPLDEAAEKAGCSRQTLYRLWHKKKIRIGKHEGNIRKGKAVVCRRSLEQYLASIEMGVPAA